MNFTVPDLYDFLRGPGFVISILVFLTGFIYRTLTLIRATNKIKRFSFTRENIFAGRSVPENGRVPVKFLYILKTKIRKTIFATNPVMGITSLVFHILLFITPVFLSAHNIIADLTIGTSLISMPEGITDIFTILIIAIGAFLLARRIFIPHVRMISTIRDYIILLLVMAPFISGYFAYHHFFNYQVVIFSHMIIGEIAIMIFPFTSLVHMPFIIFSRFFMDSEFSIMNGSRSW